jgi:ribonuclease E
VASSEATEAEIELSGEPSSESTEPAAETASEETEATELHIEGVPERTEEGVEPEEEQRGRLPRSRRGGRRRRREGAEEELSPLAKPGAEQPELPPYVGPTPANPFGGHVFDIFELIEGVEERGGWINRPATPEPPAAASATAETPEPATPAPHPVAAAGTDSAEGERKAMEPDAAPGITEPVASEPVAASADAFGEAEMPAPAETAPAPENQAAVQPIIVGTETEPVEKKRGWWRR